MKRFYHVLLVIVCCFPLCSLAQKTISGKVTSAKDGTPLTGVTVMAGSAKNATATNEAGEFKITVPNNTKAIRFSYVGFADVEEKLNGRDVVNVRMAVSDKDLGEVVVVGYGTQKKTTLTGSVSTLKSAEVVVTKNESVVNMLTGKVPGLRMVQKTSEPGGYENAFDIRGYGSAPLIVIDGVPRAGFEKMDPNEIESISILKDAAAAIYGVRASNGVVLITTKKGNNRDGKFDISYSVNQAWQQFLGMPEGVGAVDYMMLTNEKAKRDFGRNFMGNDAPAYSYGDILPWIEGRKGADWIDAAFKTTSPQIQHNLNIMGGTDKVSAFFNIGYMKQDGLLKSGDLDYSRWNLRSNVNIKITNRLRAQVLLSGHLDEKNQPFQDLWTIFKYTWNQIPINQIYANDNKDYLNVMPDNANPVGITDASKVGYRKRKQKNLQGQANLEYDIPGIKGLKAKAMFNYGYNVDDNTDYRKAYNLYTYNADEDKYLVSNVNGPSNLNRSYGNSISTISQLSLSYNHSFLGAHNVGALFLYEQSHYKTDNFFANRNMLFSTDYLFGGETAGQLGNTALNALAEVATKALTGRVTYDYRGKYLAEFTIRRDGSNKYKPGPSQWGTFPAGSVGWRISEEPFFRNTIPSNLISNLKIRASYGVLGYDGGTAFQYLPGYIYPTVDRANGDVTVGTIFNGTLVNGAVTRGLVNEDLTWYTSHTKNIGLDFTILKNLEGTFDIFRRDQKGLTAKRIGDLPGTAGVSLPDENLNSDRSEGWELSLNYKNRIGDIGYMIGGNFSSARRINRTVVQAPFGNAYDQWRNGASNRYTNIWWGVDYAGQFTSYDQIYNYKTNAGGGNNNVIPGDYYFSDWNEDGVIDGNDYHPIATFDLPLMNFGFNIGVTYKGIDLTALFAGATGVYTQYAEQYAEPLMYGRSALTKFLDSWHTVNPDDNVFDPHTQWIPGNYPAMGYNYGNINNSTKAVLNASYVRLKTLELGYTLPQSLLKRAGIKNFRAYVNSYNLFTITGLEGVDPEHPGQIPTGDFQYGLGGYKYPLNRTFNVGATISF
ncbi:MAG: TonB-dependent receptor [Ferruginibacter sp.]